MNDKSVPLSALGRHAEVRITNITGGFRFQQRLQSMGIHDGQIIKIKSKQPFRGPLTIEVCGSQMTIGRGMANKIQVELIE